MVAHLMVMLLASTAAVPDQPPRPVADLPAAENADTTAQADEQDIVVTAQRREQRLQDVPVAVAVLDDKTLTNTGTYNVSRLVQLQPSVQFYSSNPRNSSINIRGLGAPFGLTNDGIEQGVGLYIDQVYYSRPAASSFDFIDIDQIEVLRGPQSTLYGKNTTAGTINIATKAPSFTREGRAEVTVGNYDFVQAKASISGPLIDDKLAIRLAVTGTSRSGTLLNTATGARENEQKNIGFRGSLLWKPRDDLKLTLYGDFSHQDPNCCTQVYARVAPTLRAANRQYPGLAAAFNYAVPSTNPFDRLVDNDTRLRARQNFGGTSLLAEWDVGAGTLTSVTAWRFWDWTPSSDRDYIGLPITTISANASKQRQLTQEFRYASNQDHRFSYIVGLFGYRQVIDTNGVQEQGSAANIWLLGPTTAAANPNLVTGLRQVQTVHFVNNSVAAFGKLFWKPTDTLTLQGGLRINYDSKDANYNAVVSGGLANPTPAQQALKDGVLANQAYAASFGDTNISGDATISWKAAHDVLLYGTYARAFKSAGLNLGGLPADAAGRPILSAARVKPETVDHFEIGAKTQFLDRRATLNLAGFWTEIGDYQATVTNGQLGVLRGYLANAQKVRVRGIEAEFSARPTDRLNFYANGTYNDAKYVRFVDAPPPIQLSGGSGAAAVNSVDISGQRLAGVSKWQLSYGAEYSLPLKGHGGQLYAGADGSYRSSFSSNPTPSTYTDVPGYQLINFRVGYRDADGWNVFGWVRNATNTNYFEFLTVQPGNSGLIVGQLGDPRTYGFTIARKF